jgi:hypothetical protein
VVRGAKAEATIVRLFPGFVGIVEKCCWGVKKGLVGGKSLRMWELIGSKCWGHRLRKRRILSEEEGVGEEAKTAKMIDGEWEECDVLLVDGSDYVLIRKVAMGATAEFAFDAAKVSLWDIGWVGQLRLTWQMRRDRGDGDVEGK